MSALKGLADDALGRDQLAVASISFREVAMLARERRIVAVAAATLPDFADARR